MNTFVRHIRDIIRYIKIRDIVKYCYAITVKE